MPCFCEEGETKKKITSVRDRERAQARSPSVSVVILNYNGETHLGDLLDQNIESVLGMMYDSFEVVFVDNGSDDNSVERIWTRYGDGTRLKVVQLNHNYGYATGNNLGATYCSPDSKYLLFLNTDTIVRRDLLKRVIGVLEENGDIGALYPWAIPMQGRPKSTLSIDDGRLLDVPFCGGWCLAIRKQLFEALDGFDEDFFICGEDVDLGWRVWLAGYRNVLLKGSLLRHKGGGTVRWESPEVFYFQRRNKIFTIFKNSESWDLLAFLPTHIGISIVGALCRALTRVNGGEYLKMGFLAVIHGLRGAKRNRKKRITPVSKLHYNFARQSANLRMSNLVNVFLGTFHEHSS